MKGVGWSLSFLIAIFLSVSLADEASSDLKNDTNKEIDGRSGAASEDADSAEAIRSRLTQEAKPSEGSKVLSETKRFFGGGDLENFLKFIASQGQAVNQQSPSQSGRYQSQNEYGQVLKPSPNGQSTNPRQTLSASPKSASSASKVSMSGPENLGQFINPGSTKNGEVLLQHAISRLIPYNQHVFPHYSPGGNNAVVCTREGELHNVWSSNYKCLVCACISYSGLLRPVCASCSGCMAPGPDPDPYVTETPYTPVIPVTFAPPPEEQISCKPLPIDQPFENPLHPCQVCVCTESIAASGKPDVRIRCQENPQCVLPPNNDVIHIVPDQPSTLCDEFPLNVKFPHPSDVCQSCSCSVQLSPYGQPEKVITCSVNPDCTPDYPVTTAPFWPPTTIRPGPLPGPSPHASCRPYVPNQPFEHPWDECQMCVCTEANADNLVTVEISCFTKKSCCIEPPENLFPPVTALPPYQPPQNQDQLCQYRPYGVEFPHPSDQCAVCTCEVQGQRILPLCRVKNTPDCYISGNAYPGSSIGKSIQENTNSVPGSIIYNGGSSSSAQNNANSKNFLPYPGSYGPAGQIIGASHSSAGSNIQSSQQQKKLENSQSGYGVDTQHGKKHPIGGYSNYNPNQYVIPGQGGYPQNYYPASGIDSLQRFRPPGLIHNTPPELILSQSHAQATASASASAAQNAYGYAPGHQAGGLAYPGLNKIRNQQLSQSVASAQASAKSSKPPKGRSGNPDDKTTSKEN